MRGLRFFGKVLGAWLVLVVIISTFSSIFLLAFTTQLFRPGFYLDVLEQSDLFDRLPEIAAAQIRYSMTFNPCLEDPAQCENGGPQAADEEGGPPSYFQALSENDWEALLRELLPPDWLQDQIQDLVENLVESIRTGSDTLVLSISLFDFKQNLSGQTGVAAITRLMKAQPDCSQADLLEMTRILEGRQDPGKDFLSCNPGDEFLDNYAPQIEVLLRRSLRDVPDEISLARSLSEEKPTVPAFGLQLPLPVFLNFLRWTVLVSPLLILFLITLVALLAVHSYQGLAGWIGYPLAFSGLLGFGLASLVSPASDFLMGRFISGSSLSGFHDKLIEAASVLVLVFLRLLFTRARNFSLIAFGIGVSIVITAAVLKRSGVGTVPPKQTSGEVEAIPDDGLKSGPGKQAEETGKD